MKTKDLVELVKQGATPIVRIKDGEGVLEGPDTGMLGRIISVGAEDSWERGTSTIPFTVDFLEFTEHNKAYAVANWYAKDGTPSLNWMETDGYERDAKSHLIFEMYVEKSEYADLSYLELVEENKWLNKYIESGSNMTYTQWLESQLDLVNQIANSVK